MMPPMPERAKAIIEEVADRHRLHPTMLVGPGRLRPYVRARREAMALIRALDPEIYSLARIGRMFNRDESTVASSIVIHNRGKSS